MTDPDLMSGDSRPIGREDGSEVDREAGRPVDTAHAIPRGIVVCARCGRELAPGRDRRSERRRFCSGKCRARSSREKQAARVGQIEDLIARLAQLAGTQAQGVTRNKTGL
jgi:hypothetical protein